MDKKTKPRRVRRSASTADIIEVLSDILLGEKMEDTIIMESLERGIRNAQVVATRPAVRERIKAAELLGQSEGIFTKSRRKPKAQDDPLIVAIKQIPDVQ